MNNHDLFATPADTDADALARLHQTLERAAEEEGLLDVAYRTVDSPVGTLLLAATPRGLVRVAYDVEGHDQVLDTLASRLSPRVLRAPRRLDAVARELEEYFGGRRRSFDLPLDLSLSKGFRLLVQQHLASIGYAADPQLPAGRRARREPEGGTGGRHRLRHQPAAGRAALPPGAPRRRHARRLRRRSGRQDHAAEPGGGRMSTARARSTAGHDPWRSGSTPATGTRSRPR